MNLIILYGPPASGKLTVAKALAKKTGYALLHNHLIADLASSLFPFGTKEYSDLAQEVRLASMRAAFRSKMPGVILTLTYGVETYLGQNDNALARRILGEAKKFRVKAVFVQLTCPEKELARRVKNKSRRQFKKLSKAKDLAQILKKYPVRKRIPFVKSLVIDTGKIKPARAADIITEKTA